MSKDSCCEIKKFDEMKWRAESLVSDAMKGTAKFKKAVKLTIAKLKQQEKEVKKIVLGQSEKEEEVS